MQLIDQQSLYFELKPESLEDLWLLTQIISSDDTIYSSTKRKVALGDDKKKQVTKIISVDLKVKKIVFESDVLRVSGEILNETQFTTVGQSHTLTFTPGDTIKIQKNQLLNVEKQYLDKSLSTKSSLNLLVLLDKDDLVAVQFSDFSFSVLAKETGLGSKKYKENQINDEEQKFLLLKDLLEKQYSNVILMGPAHFKDTLKEYIKTKMNLNVLSVAWPDTNSSSIEAAISYLGKQGIVESSELKREGEAIATLLYNIEKGQKAIYGLDKTKESVEQGACETLLISTKLIDKKREENTFEEINEVMKLVENLNGSIVIINSKHTPGKQLDGLGGIAGILRY